jgi:hypothetical protein
MSEAINTTEYGVQYPDGTEDWSVSSWYGNTLTDVAQKGFQEQYEMRLASLGVKAGSVKFVQREVTTTYGDPEEFTPFSTDGDAEEAVGPEDGTMPEDTPEPTEQTTSTEG